MHPHHVQDQSEVKLLSAEESSCHRVWPPMATADSRVFFVAISNRKVKRHMENEMETLIMKQGFLPLLVH